MGLGLNITTLSLLLLLASAIEAHSSIGFFDVTKYANGVADISLAFLTAWKEACESTSPSKVVIPQGTYLLSQVTLEGPCKAPIEVEVLGTLKAPTELNKFQPNSGWVTFQRIDQFKLSGTGTFDGQGSTAWLQHDCGNSGKCDNLPDNLRLNFISNGIIEEITSEDSNLYHIHLFGCKNVTFQQIAISAPQQNLKTDGIHIGRSTGINISNSKMATGGECVSITSGSKQISVSKITCGPGLGISIVGAGNYGNEGSLLGINVKNCTLGYTSNGVRIITLPSSNASTAAGIQFEDILMNNVSNPVLIDQGYCPDNQCKEQSPSLIKISNVRFKNIWGTSATQRAVKLVCSSSVPCQDVDLIDIDLTHNGNTATSECSNIHPRFYGKQNPSACGKR